ncbi:MAG: hypothetical protein ACRC1K_16355, partial [Planctomycetia bacterium]
TGAVLVGRFSVDRQGADQPFAEEKYTIVKARKMDGDRWLIIARIQYGKNDYAVPIGLSVFWADDTPVISLTDVTLPGAAGKFTARVLIHRNKYAGTWSHDEVGGNLWGRIERASADETKAAEEKAAEKAKEKAAEPKTSHRSPGKRVDVAGTR